MNTQPKIYSGHNKPVKIDQSILKIIANDSAKVHKRQHDFAANAYLQYAESQGQLIVYQSNAT